MLQKAYREEGKKEAGCSLYALMPQTIETVFAKELTKTQSDVSLYEFQTVSSEEEEASHLQHKDTSAVCQCVSLSVSAEA